MCRGDNVEHEERERADMRNKKAILCTFSFFFQFPFHCLSFECLCVNVECSTANLFDTRREPVDKVTFAKETLTWFTRLNKG